MRNYDDCCDHFVQNNLHEGTFRERYAHDPFWFRGNVMFQHERPIFRLEKTITGSWIALRGNNHWGHLWDGERLATVVQKPLPGMHFWSIGVAHPYNGGVLRGEEFHQHMHAQMLGNMEHLLDDARYCGILLLSQYGANRVMRAAEELEQKHFDYRLNLAPELPDMGTYHVKIAKIVSDRLAVYNSDASVARRARKHAKALANEALSLSTRGGKEG